MTQLTLKQTVPSPLVLRDMLEQMGGCLHPGCESERKDRGPGLTGPHWWCSVQMASNRGRFGRDLRCPKPPISPRSVVRSPKV